MSADLKKMLVRDNRLHVSDKVNFAIFQGGQNVSKQAFKANTATTNSITFNIQVPSEQTLIDRRVYLEATVTFKIVAQTFNDFPLGEVLFQYGRKSGFSPFPLHQMINNQSATINSATTTQNLRDNLSILLKMLSAEDLAYYNSYTPTALDTYAFYNDGVGANNNVLGGYQNNALGKVLPRGAFIIEAVGSNEDCTVNQIVNDGVTAACKTAYVRAKFFEPLMLSPFIYNPNLDIDCSAMYGVQNMSFNFTLADGNRSIRTVFPNCTASIAKISENCNLNFTFLTAKPSQLLPAQNVLKYYEIPRYPNVIPAIGLNTASSSYTSSSLQLNQIPQYLFIAVRKPVNTQKPNDADVFYPIKKVSIQFNNLQGILSNANQVDLYRMTCENGVQTNWLEYSGQAVSYPNLSFINGQPQGLIKTTGSPLCLMMGKDIQITEDYYTIGSLGNFNLQVSCEFDNPYVGVENPQLEMVIFPMNVGTWVNSKGISNYYTGLITKQDALDASSGEAMSENEVKRYVGGAFGDRAMGLLSKALENAPGVLKTVCKVQDALGSGKTGAGLSGGMARRLK